MFQVAATKRSRSRTQRFSSALFRRGSVWFKTEKVFALLNIIALLLPSLVVWPTTAYAVNATIRQEINLIDGYFTAPTGDYATTSAIIQIDTNNYNGASFYFEAVASTTSATPAMLTLKNARTFASSTSMWVRGTASALYRSAVFTPTAGANDYVAVWGNDSTGKSAAAIRIVVIQTAASITDTETQIEIGSEETYTSSATSTFTAPKYWYYDGTKWDGSVNYYAEVTYANTLGSATTTSRFTTAGTSNIIASTTLAIVAAWGGGGAGFDGANTGGGAGGGGGAFASSTLPLTPGSTTPITVGAGGSASAGNGATSTFSNLVSAPGGTGGKSVTTAIGYGGVGTLGVGTTKFSGGNGGQGVGTDDGGGGGGGAGGPHGNGGTGATASATIGGGGGGGDGGNNGTNGTPPNGGSSVNGGAGGDGGNGGNGTNGTSNNNGGGGGGGGDNGTNGGNGGSPGGGGGGGETGTWLGAAGAIELKFRPTASTTIVLQKDDGAFGTWTDVVYIVSADEFRHATSTRKRSAAFTPETGKNYRIAFREGYDGAAHTIYNAKIIVDQTGSPTKYEPQYLLANKTLAGGTALQNYFTSWDPAEWSGVAPIFTHEASSQSGGASDALIQNTSGPATISGSDITNIGYRATSTTAGMTMPVSAATLDVLADANNGDVYASRILVQVSPLSAPTVTTQSAASMTRTTATLNGTITVTGGATIVSRGFAWGTDPTLLGGDTATTSENGSFGTGAFTNTSIVFTCGTTYYSRAFAANSQGTSTGAVSASFATSACFTPTTFSGRIYTDEGTTELASAGKTLMVRVGTSTAGFFSTSTIAANGFWQIPDIDSGSGFYAGMPIHAWIDGDTTFRSFTFTKASSSVNNISGINLYQNYVVVKHEGFIGTSTTNTDLGVYDADDDSDIQFTATPNVLSIRATSSLLVAAGSEFKPGGAITIHGNGLAASDGNLRLATGLRQDGTATTSILTMGTNPITLAGNWFASSTSRLNTDLGQVVTLNSTSSATKLIVATTSPFNSLFFSGAVGASWSFGASAATTTRDFLIATGTVSAPSTDLTIKRNFGNYGTFTQNSGTVSLVAPTSTLASTLATYISGRDASGDSTGTGFQVIYSIAISGNYAYVGKSQDATACSQTAGSAIGCEFMVFNITDPNYPTYVAGRDASGDSTGTGLETIYSIAISGNYAYVGKSADATACSQTAGSAIGCEFMVFDITDPTSPTYVAGRDASGDSTGTGSANVYSIAISGNYAYVGKSTDTTACSQTAGSAIGCEFMVFDITDPTSPTYVAGRDESGDSTGTGSANVYSIAISGNYAYVGKSGSLTACSQTAGNARGCELMVFDISNPLAPTYVAGRDSSGSSAGTGSSDILSITISGNYVYVGKSGSSTACSQTAGSAYGCEFMVFDISNPLSPTYVVGRDVTGDSTGAGSVNINSIAISGNYAYVGKGALSTACSQTAGSAPGCELMVFDITSPTSPTYVAGRDASGNSTNTGSETVRSIAISGNYVYVGKSENATACSQTAGSALGCELMVFSNPNLLAGNMTGTSALGNVLFSGAGPITFLNNASTTNFTINSGATTSVPALLSIAGNYTNNGTFTHNSGTVFFGTTTVSLLGSLSDITLLANTALAALNSTDVAFIDTLNADLRTYRWNGTTWTLLGSLDNITTVGTPALAALNSTDVAFIDNTNDDLRTYRWNGTTWTLLGSLNNIATVGTPALAALNSTDIAFIDDTNDDLRTYRWNGTTWTLLGSLDNIANVFTTALAALNSTDVAFIDVTNADLRTYRWNGTTWTLLGSLDNIATVGTPALTALNSIDVAFIDYTNADLRTYRIGGTATGTMTGGSAWNNLTIVGKAALGANASTTNLTLASASSTLTAPSLLTIAGNYTNNGTFSANSGTVYFATSSPATQTLSGTMTGGMMTTIPTAWNAFHNIEFLGSGTKSFGANASTTGSVTINSGAPVTAPTLLSIGGNYTNSGTFTHNAGTVYLNGTTQQTLSGTMTGTSAFRNLTIFNTSGTGGGVGLQSIIFANAASTTGTFTMVASTSAQFLAGAATSSFNGISLNGGGATSPVWLRSSSAGTPWGIVATNTQSVNYVNVKDSYACAGDSILDTNGTDEGGNTCWSFVVNLPITFSGRIYTDEGTTQLASAGKTLMVRVGTSTAGFFATSTIAANGFWQIPSISNTNFFVGMPVHAWIDGDSTFRAFTFTKASSTAGNITGLDLYQNYVIVKHEGFSGTSTTNADLAVYDRDDDPDLMFTAVAAGALNVNATTSLYIAPGSEFAPGGAITLHGNGLAASDGNLRLATGLRQDGTATTSILTMGTNPIKLAGNWFASSTSRLNTDLGQIVTLNSTSSATKLIVATSSPFNTLFFSGAVGASWSFGANAATTTLDFLIATGTVSAPSTDLAIKRNFSNAGTFTQNSGTVSFVAPTTTLASTLATYISGRDASGDSTGTGNSLILSIAISGNYAYVGKFTDATPCSQTPGSAIGCEFQVYDITDPNHPVYVAGRDVSGDSTGTGLVDIRSIAISGNYAYVGKAADATACSQTAGSAIGCELMVFDISSPTSPTYVAGRDASGDSTGTGSINITSIAISGNYAYVGKWADATACSQTAGSAIGCELMVFDISNPLAPTYVAGRDVKGDSTGTGFEDVRSIAISGNYAYVGKYSNATACSQTAGSAIGCEFQVFDITNPTNPTYVAGRDASGNSTGTGANTITSITISGNYAYVGKSSSATACSQTAGSAIGCEFMVFDISNPLSPTYVAGRDASGNSTGTGSIQINSIAISGNYAYVGKSANATACSQTAGSAIGCEFMVFDISTPTNSTYVDGRDVKGDSTGTGSADIYSIAISGNYAYVGKTGNATACSQTAGSAIGCEFMVFSNPNLLVGNMTGTSALGNVLFAGAGPITFLNNASTTNFTINSGATTSVPALLSIAGDYINNGKFTPNQGAVYFGTSTQAVTYVAGRDVKGDSTGTGLVDIRSIAISGNYAYVGKAADATACSQVAGSATGCEFQVYDITDPTNPVYVAGRDASGSAAGTGSEIALSIAISGNYAYVGSDANATACSQIAGSAIGCELQVYDITDPINPIYVAGRDVKGDSTGTGLIPIFSIAISGNYAYVGKNADATACSQTAGSAIGCELMVFDISSPTNPVYIAGRDSDGSAAGTLGTDINSIAISGNYAYVGKFSHTTACSQTAGSAIGCELMVFRSGNTLSGTMTGTSAFNTLNFIDKGGKTFLANASTSANLTIDVSSGIVHAPNIFTVGGNYGNATTSGFFHGNGTVVFSSTTAQTLSGIMTGASAFASTTFSGVGAKTFANNASTTKHFVIDSTSGAITAPSLLSIGGNYTNNSTFTHNAGTVYLNGYATQTLSGSMIGTNAFRNLTIFNTSGTGGGAGLQSVIFANAASTTGTFTMVASTSAQFASGAATSSFNGISWNGTTASPVWLRSSNGGTPWGLVATNTQAVTYVNVKDSYACAGDSISVLNGTDEGGNNCWNFITPLTFSGRIYTDEGTTELASAGKTLMVRVGTSTAGFFATSTVAANGFWQIQDILPTGFYTSMPVHAWIDGDATFRAFTFTKASSSVSNITGLDLYKDYVIVKHEGFSGTSTTNTDLGIYDADDDSDIQFTATVNVLSVRATSSLYVAAGTTFVPGGAITIHGNGLAASDGNLRLATGLRQDGTATTSILTMGTNPITLAGNWFASSTSRLNTDLGQIVTLNSTSSATKLIVATSSPFNSLFFSGAVGASWSFGANAATTTLDFLIATGTVSAPSTDLAIKRNFSNAGTFTQGSGTVSLVAPTSTLASTLATYISGRDVTGDSAGTGNQDFNSIAISGNYAYVGKSASVTACSQTAGSAIGCELQVYDITDPTNPVYVAGRDVKGDSTGTGGVVVYSIAISGNYAYVGKGASATACSQTAGSAIGCELMVFDISSPTNPVYVAGRDVTGDSTGAGSVTIYSIAISGNYAYVGKNADATACSQTAGSAIGCELMVFDISSPTSPTYVAGRDVKGDSAGTGSLDIYSIAISGNYAYVGKWGNATACSQTAGLAHGCELMVFDISSPTSPTYVAGRDATGDSTGTGNIVVNSIAISGNYAYVGKDNDATACSQTAGSAIGCEFMVFDISSPTSPTYVVGRDASGDSTGTGDNVPIESIAISGNYAYVVKSNDATACSQVAGSAIGCEFMVFSNPNLLVGNMTGTSALGNVLFAGAGPITFLNNASTTNFTINSGATTSAPTLLSIAGNYTNNSTFTHNAGTVYLNGTSQQTLSGTLTGTSAFRNLTIFNTSGTGGGAGLQSVIFANAASTTGTFTMVASTSAQFASGAATSSFNGISWNGTTASPVWLRSSNGGTPWGLVATNTQAVTYVNVKDSYACAGDSISVLNGTDSGGNNCWNFLTPLTFSGRIYTDEGTTQLASAGKTLMVRVGTSTAGFFATSTIAANGFWQIQDILPTGVFAGMPVHAWIDGDSTFKAFTFTKASSSVNNITGLDLYKDYMIVKHEGFTGTSTTNADLAVYDRDDDPDLMFTAVAAGALNVNATTSLYIAPGSEFAPGGAITIHGNGLVASDGNLRLATGLRQDGTASTSILTMGTNALTLAGSWFASSTSIFTQSGIITLNSTSSAQKLIVATSSPFNTLFFNGSSGASWSFGANAATTTLDFLIATGTVSAPSTDLAIKRNFGNYGTFTQNSGTVSLVAPTSTLASTLATYISGRDASGSAAGTGSVTIFSIAISGNYAYVVKEFNATACSQTAGSADGCEFMVFDITDPNSPVYVAGRDSDGSAAGTLGPRIESIAISGNYAYVGKTQNTTACSQTAGSAQGCEFMVFDISNPLSPTYVAGRDSDGSSTGTLGTDILSLAISGNYAYVGKRNDATACSQTSGSADGCEFMVFDISNPTSPIYVAGRDASGDSTGTGSGLIFSLAISGNYAYVGKYGDATACSQTAGSAIGCEFMVFDISTPTNPIYVAGRDSSGSAAGTLGPPIYSIAISGNYAYVGKGVDVSACSQIAGSADGCEFIVFDVATPTNPVYVAGRDVKGDSTGTGSGTIYSIAVSGTYAYVGKDGSATACSQTAGSAIGCELMVFDISSPTSPTYIAGRDVSGDSTGTGSVRIDPIAISGNYVYVGKGADLTACSQTAGSAIGCEFMVFSNPNILAGNMTGTSALGNVLFSGAGPVTFMNNASTTNFTVNSGATTSVPAYLTISGNYTNSGTFTHNSGTVYFDSTSAQSLAGTMTGTNAFASTTFIGSGTKTFGSNASTTNLFTINSGATVVAPSLLTIGGNYTQNGSFTDGGGSNTVYFESASNQTLAGTMNTLATDFNHVQFLTGGTKTLSVNASTTDFTVGAGVTLSASALLSIAGNYTQSGTFTHNQGAVYFGTSTQAVTYVAGRDVTGDSTGTGNFVNIYSIAISGNYAYVGKHNDGTACSQTAGSAIGCELQVYDITDPTNPIYIAGRDASGDSTGTGYTPIYSIAISGNYAYVGKGNNATACSQTAGSAIGCELMVFDISNPLAPTYVAGLDSSGSAAGTLGPNIFSIAISGNYAYVVKGADSTACSQTAGSADGCEFMVFDISNPLAPTYIAGRDVSGDSTGVSNIEIYSIAISGNYAYVGKGASGTACSQTAGNARGCELMVFDISNPLSPTYVAGRDASGDSTGTGNVYIHSIAISGNYAYGGKGGDATACSQIAGSAIGCELMVFDISNPLSPTYVAGRDASGDSTGTGAIDIYSLAISGNYAYGGKLGNATACSQTAGSAIGCEFMFFDVSSPTSPTYVAGRDVSGDSTGTGSIDISSIAISGNYAYVGKNADLTATACSQTAGSAIGCELMVFRMGNTLSGTMTGSSAFNTLNFIDKGGKTFVNNASTTANLTIDVSSGIVHAPNILSIGGNYSNATTSGFFHGNGTVLFGSSTAQTLSGIMTGASAFASTTFSGAGIKTFSANASTTKHFLIDSTSGTLTAPTLLSIAGNYTNSGTFTAGTGVVYLNGAIAQTLSGTLTGTSAFASTTFLGAGTKSFGATAASTTGNFVIDSTSGAVTAPSTYLTIGGNYTNSATAGFTHNSGTTTFSGTIAQTLSGNMIAGNAFAHLEFINSSATTTFMNSASSTNFFASSSNIHLEFAPGATTSVYGNLVLHGTSGSPVNIFSTTNGSPWYIYASSTYAITYTNIQDSSACARELDVSTGGTNSDRGGNSCWIFTGGATFAALANQIFTVGDAPTAISQLTITDSGTPVFTAANDLRIAIATSTTFMLWDTSITGATFSGTACPDPYAASCKVSTTTLSYEGGGSVLLIPVTTNFDAADTLIFSGLKFMTFATASAPVAGLTIFKDGPSDQAADATNSKTITIKGLTAGAEHTALQFTNQIDVSGVNLTSLALYAFNLFVAGGESMSVTNLTFNLSGVQGIAAGDITNAKVYIDYDGDKTVDAGDTQVGGAGAVTITGETGTIIFSTTFTATTTRDYILQADVASVGFADGITLTLTPSAVTASGLTSLQTTSPTSTVALSSARHSKVPRGGSEVGSTAPTGAGIVTGGGQGGGTPGETIGSDPGFFPPTTTGGSYNEWTTPSSGYLSDGAYATAATSWFRQDYGGFGFNTVPSTNTVTGIEVKLELSGSSAVGTVSVALSWDGGTSTTSIKTSPTLTTADAVVTLGSVSDTWGRTWTPAQLADANFKVRLVAEPSSNTVQVDAIQVKVTHIATGGSQGGGGEAINSTKARPMYVNLAAVYLSLPKAALGIGQNLYTATTSLFALVTEKVGNFLFVFF